MIRFLTKGIQIFIDLFLLSLAYWLAFLFRFEFSISGQATKLLFFTWPYVVLFQYIVMVLFGIPDRAWRYIGLRDMTRFVGALGVATTVLIGFRLGFGKYTGTTRYIVIPISIIAIDFVMAFLFITGARVLRRILAEREERSKHASRTSIPRVEKRTVLIGAGRAGVAVAKEVQQNPNLGILVIGFLDDDPRKKGAVIQGTKVLGKTGAIAKIKEIHEIDQAIISIAAANGADIRRIVTVCEKAKLPVKIIPGIYEIIGGKVNLSRIREVTIDDLLGREVVELDIEGIKTFLLNKRVLITGAGGSIGSELCRQAIQFHPESIVLLEQAENPLFEIHKELMPISGDVALYPRIADVCDVARIRAVFEEFKPHVVFHAAAHKHVPMMEWNPGEAVKNNIFGTKTIADAADAGGAQSFVMISTDKAVNPTSVMGATKRVAELYIQGMSQISQTTFSAVRFGNVLGSAGSVIPIFKKQIAAGGPITVTHPEMKRYFMTIPEACQLVMQAASMGCGGEIFVLDMGKPVKIVDLAKDLIRLSGFAEEEISIEFVGVRPGEKLFEELSTSGEDMAKTRHPKIYIGKIESFPIEEIETLLGKLSKTTESFTKYGIRDLLGNVIPELEIPEAEKHIDDGQTQTPTASSTLPE